MWFLSFFSFLVQPVAKKNPKGNPTDCVACVLICFPAPLLPQILLLQRFKCSVYRRYNDFVVFHEMLLQKFPYRMVPALPPKRMLGGKPGPFCWVEGWWCECDRDDTVEKKCLKGRRSLLNKQLGRCNTELGGVDYCHPRSTPYVRYWCKVSVKFFCWVGFFFFIFPFCVWYLMTFQVRFEM